MSTENAINAADALIAHLKRTTPRHTEYTLTPNRVEEMLAATIPGGSVADPQEIADAIREWFGYSYADLKETPCSALDCDLAAEYRKAVEVLEAIEKRYIDGCDTYEDWKAMGELARSYFLARSKEEPTSEATACSPSVEELLAEENRQFRKAGCKLAEAALHVAREYDGVHRLMLAVSEWAMAVANEGGRGNLMNNQTKAREE